MDERQKKGVIVVVILAAAVGVGTFMLFVPRMHEHYEAQHDDQSSFFISVGGDDMTINISFVNDSLLLYSIDVEKYPDTTGYSFEEMHGGSRVEFGADRLKQVTVVFGTAVPYAFGIAGENVTAYVTYDNGAIIDGQECDFNHQGSVNYGTMHFTFTENVTVKGDMDVTIGRYAGSLDRRGHAYLDIDIPDTMSGRLTTVGDTDFIENIGWIFDESWGYTTPNWGDDPGLWFHVSYPVTARLHN